MTKRKLKIAILHLAFIYSGGGEKLVLEEATGLKKLGHKVDIYTCIVDKKNCFLELTKNIEIREFLPWARAFLKGHEAFQVVLSAILAPIFIYKFKDYDVIFAANQPSLWIAYVAKLLLSKKYVGYLAQPTRFLYPRKIDKETGLYFVKKETVSLSAKLMKVFKKLIKHLDMLSVKGSDRILVNGEYMTELINKVYKINALNCPAGADYISKPATIKSRREGKIGVNGYSLAKPYILMTNRHVWQKRLEYGLTAFSGLFAQRPDYSLVITGCKTEYTKELEVEINRLGLTSKVFFVGLVKQVDLSRLYKNAAVYLYTAPEEDFGMGVIEALGQGTPVVAWNKAGPSCTNVDRTTGFLITAGDTKDFTAKLTQIVSNNIMAYSMSKNAILRVKTDFSWKHHFSVLVDTLQSLVN
jgi:glycosyltransferase involved in cell wall biosynthesis